MRPYSEDITWFEGAKPRIQADYVSNVHILGTANIKFAGK